MTGKQYEFTPEVADEICDRLAKGQSLRSICADKEGDWLPSARTFHRWLASDEEWAEALRQQYAHAREMQADAKFDEADDIAKSATPETVQVARLQIDTIKWQTSKLAPKKYGEKVTTEHTGAGGGPIQIITGVPRAGD